MVLICDKQFDKQGYDKAFSEIASFTLSDFQKWAIKGIIDKDHVLITAHTGSGKTLPAEFMMKYFTTMADEDGRERKKVIYASSSSVYCDQNRSKFDETDTALEPKSFYAETKLMNEKYAENFSLNNRKVVIGLRFFSVYGPYGRPDMAYYSFTESILKNKKIILYNNGLMSRDMTYIDDIIIGINQVIKYMQNFDGSHHEIFNLGNGTPVTTSDLLGTIEKKLEKKALVIHKTSMNESKFTCANLNKSKKHLKYLPKTKFNNGIDRFINWYLKYGKF